MIILHIKNCNKLLFFINKGDKLINRRKNNKVKEIFLNN